MKVTDLIEAMRKEIADNLGTHSGDSEETLAFLAKHNISTGIALREASYKYLAKLEPDESGVKKINLRADFVFLLWAACYYNANLYHDLVLNGEMLFDLEGKPLDSELKKINAIYRNCARKLQFAVLNLGSDSVLPFSINTHREHRTPEETAAFACLVSAINFIVAHEIAHVDLEGLDSYNAEFEADSRGLKKLCRMVEHSGAEYIEAVTIGGLSAIGALFLTTDITTRKETTHPSPDKRLKRAMKYFRENLNAADATIMSGFLLVEFGAQLYNKPIRWNETNALDEILPDILLGVSRFKSQAGKVDTANLMAFDSEEEAIEGLYPVFYGTNRQKCSPDSGYYSSERDKQLHTGVAKVFVPESHSIGKIDQSWLRELFSTRHEKLKVISVHPKDALDLQKEFQAHDEQMLSKDNSILIYVHGYNNSFEDAIKRAAQIGLDLKIKSPMCVFCWPSQGRKRGYWKDEAAVEASEKYFAEFFRTIRDMWPRRKINILAHSMGNRLVLRALKDLADNTYPDLAHHAIFTAPDVDADIFRHTVARLQGHCRNTSLYTSTKDKALWFSKRLHGAPRAGYHPPILIDKTLTTIAVDDIDLDFLGHGYHATMRPVLSDLYALIHFDKHATERFDLKPMSTAEGSYFAIRA